MLVHSLCGSYSLQFSDSMSDVKSMYPRTDAGLKRTTVLHHTTLVRAGGAPHSQLLPFFYHGSRAVCAWTSAFCARPAKILRSVSLHGFHAHQPREYFPFASIGYVVYSFFEMIESSTSLAVRLDVL